MNQKEIACKIANNSLEFLIDPTVVPVRQHLYFRPEEILRNEVYEEAKADAQKAYGDQRHNSDFYPIRNRTKSQSKEASIMDRKTLIASLDVLSQNFNENDPIGTDLRTMAYAVSKMADEELEQRTSNAWMDLMKKVREMPENKGKSVKELAGIAKKLYKKEAEAKEEVCPKCGKSECACMKEASEEVIVNDFWTKEASDAVAKALMAEVESPVEEQQEEHEKSETPEEEKKEEHKESAGQNDPRFMYQHGKKEVESKKEEVAPVEEPKKEEVPAVVEPIKEAKKEEVLPVEEPKKEEVEAKKVVDTSVLATQKFDDVELTFASEDVGELTASEKAQLDQLFK